MSPIDLLADGVCVACEEEKEGVVRCPECNEGYCPDHPMWKCCCCLRTFCETCMQGGVHFFVRKQLENGELKSKKHFQCYTCTDEEHGDLEDGDVCPNAKE